MKLLLDTCVLYPTVMREMLLGSARAGFFSPLWSERILAEWRHTGRKRDPMGGAQTEAEIALAGAAFPKACQSVAPEQSDRFWLPDAGDIHVLAAAALAGADGIVTLNNKDFPQSILAEEGLTRINPDGLLLGFLQANPSAMRTVADAVLTQANAMSERPWTIRALMKKARMPRLGKALESS